MNEVSSATCTAFSNHAYLASGSFSAVASQVQAAIKTDATASILIYDDATGRVIDLDPRANLSIEPAAGEVAPPEEPRGRGRPKLGVIAREVTLLPRHWDWLNAQPGGASVALRKLVEAARRENAEADRVRQGREAAYRFMSAMAGDLPGYEEACRALFAADRARFETLIAEWPVDVRDYALKLAVPVA